MFRTIALWIAAASLVAAPLTAEARPKKAAASEAHKPAKGRAKTARHGKTSEADEADSECAPAKSAKGRHGHSVHGSAACKSASHKSSRNEERADSSDEADAAACKSKSSHGRLGRKAQASCHSSESEGRKVHCAPVKHDHGRRGRRKCVPVEPPLPPPVFVAPRPPVVTEPQSQPQPKAEVPPSALGDQPLEPPSAPTPEHHVNPPPGVEVRNVWAQRRKDERRPRPQAAAWTLATLMGHTEAELHPVLGDPVVRREEGEGALLTYRLPSCALLVFLHRSAAGAGVSTTQGEFKVTGAQSGPLERGGSAPDVDTCLKAAGAAH